MSCSACKRNLIRGAVGLAKNALGIEQASSAVIVARLEHCRDCGKLQRFQAALQGTSADVGLMDECSLCGCLVRQKARLQDEECPLGKWES